MSSGIDKVNQPKLKTKKDKLYKLSRKEAKKIMIISKKTYRSLLKDSTVSDPEKQDNILQLRKQIHKSDIFFYKMFSWYRNITRKIREGIDRFGKGVQNLFTQKSNIAEKPLIRVNNTTITRKIREGIDGLGSRVKKLFVKKPPIRVNNYNSYPLLPNNNTIAENTRNINRIENLKIEFNVRDLLRRMKYETYGKTILKNEIAKQEFVNKTIEAFIRGIKDGTITFPSSIKKAISRWNNLISDECGQTFVNKVYFKGLDSRYKQFENSDLPKGNINVLKNTIYTSIVMLLVNGPKESGFGQNLLFTDDGKLIGLKEQYIEREGGMFDKKCLQKLLSETNISKNKKTEWMQHFFPSEPGWDNFE